MRIAFAFLLLMIASLNAAAAVEENYYPKGPWLASVNDIARCKSADGSIMRYDPKSIQKIKIITNDKGQDENMFFKFEYGNNGVCYYQASDDRGRAMLRNFQGVKGVNNEAVIKSMTSGTNAVFLFWDRSSL